ncbi:hypothetical protein [Pleionea sediminis]|uniref:hypothetical protein n=1 Tax=Pleionea sediminis TaxID=2569479 RepID=UPI001186B5F8|nr:hypothetical protein [Pleionea sediminis]
MSLSSTASELTIPNTFQSGEKALASEVNDNFTATATAVNDNDARIVALEAAVSALTQRVETLESSFVSSAEYFGTDLFFLQNDANGTLLIPVVEGNQSSSSSIQTNYEYAAVPGLDTVSFDVADDNTTVIIQASGEAYLNTFSAYSSLSVAIEINGEIPDLGAQQTHRMVSDDNLSGGGAVWDIRVPVQLDAGTHTFSVLVKGTNQNQSQIVIDGRSLEGYDGRVKTSILQINSGN